MRVDGSGWVAVLVAGGVACAAFGGEGGVADEGETGAILVTARGRPLASSRTPGSVAILTSEDARLAQAPSVADLLDRVPGVVRHSDGTWGSEISIRGLSRESVVMLVDGCRVHTATDHGARFGMVDPFDIDRVEILKGSVSSLYGSGSLGGVVNLITKSGHFSTVPETKGGVAVSVGSNPEGVGAFVSGGVNRPDAYLSLSQGYRHYESYEDGDGREVRNSGFEDTTTRLRGGCRWTESLRMDANVQYFAGRDVGIPGTGTAPLPAAADVTLTEGTRGLAELSVTANGLGAVWDESRLSVYHQFVNRRVRIDAFPESSPVVLITPGADHVTWGGRWVNLLSAGDHEVTVGADGWRRTYEGFRTRYMRTGQRVEDKPLPDSSMLSSGLFMEDDWQVEEELTLNVGGRLDAIRVHNEAARSFPEADRSEEAWDGHVGASWRAWRDLSVKVLAASGYRAASLEERFQYLDLGGGAVKIGNPELDPERSRQLECGLEWGGDRVSAGLSVFHNRVSDLIGDRRVDALTIVKENVSRAEIMGVEAEGRCELPAGVDVHGNVAWLDGDDTTRNEPLANIAPVTGAAGVGWGEREGVRVTCDFVFAGRQDEVPPLVEPTPGWTRVDMRVAWNKRTGVLGHTLYAGVNNVFDRDYRDAMTTYRGLPYDEPGRGFVGGYQLAF